MANPRLFCSALFLGLVHILMLVWDRHCPRVLAISLVLAVFTSIWNHGVTSDVAKWADRCMIGAAAGLDYYYLLFVIPHASSRPLLAVMSTSILAYFSAKMVLRAMRMEAGIMWQADMPHLCAHILQTICNVGMIHVLAGTDSCVDSFFGGLLCA